MKLGRILSSIFMAVIVVLSANGQVKDSQKINFFSDAEKWKEIKFDEFSFNIPAKMILVSDKGTDSPFWSFRDNQRMLDISIGQYVGFQQGLRNEIGYQEEKVTVKNIDALICFYTLAEPIEGYKYVARVFLLKEHGAKYSLSMTLYSNKSDEKEVSRRIFQSIQLK